MNYLVQFVNAKSENPIGSEWQRLVTDLKTVRGVKNRVLKGVKPNNAVKANIYSYTNVYDEKTYRLVDTVEL